GRADLAPRRADPRARAAPQAGRPRARLRPRDDRRARQRARRLLHLREGVLVRRLRSAGQPLRAAERREAHRRRPPADDPAAPLAGAGRPRPRTNTNTNDTDTRRGPWSPP